MLYLVFAAFEAASFAASLCLMCLVGLCEGLYKAVGLLVVLGGEVAPVLVHLLWALSSGVSYVVWTLFAVLLMMVQACGQLFRMVLSYLTQLLEAIISLNWSQLPGYIRSVCFAISNTLLYCLTQLYYAGAYTLSTACTVCLYIVTVLYNVVAYIVTTSLSIIGTVVYLIVYVVLTVFGSLISAIQFCYSKLVGDESDEEADDIVYELTDLAYIVLVVFSLFCVLFILRVCYRFWKGRGLRVIATDIGRRNQRIQNVGGIDEPADPYQRRNDSNNRPGLRQRERGIRRRNEMERDEVDIFDILPNDESLSGLNDISSLLGGSKGSDVVNFHTSSSTQQHVSPSPTFDEVKMEHKMRELERQLMKEKEANQCVVCMDQPREMIIRPCNHYCACEACMRQLRRCPICNRYFARAEKVYNV